MDGVMMNGTRIVIPRSLRDEYLRCLHTGHFGVSKCRAVGVVKEIYSKCKDDFLPGLLVHRSTPLLYPNAKSPAELFLGRKIATNIPYIPFGTAALMHCLRNLDDHDNVPRFEPNDGDSCYVRINPNENTWEKGLVIRKVIGVPDSYIVEVDGRRYCRNKWDLTLSPPGANNNDDDESDSDNHQADHNVPMSRVMMPTLHPRPHLKFPKLPAHATQQKDFNL